jgi:(p)ppGpp synthase/HD superfamily hydrolase
MSSHSSFLTLAITIAVQAHGNDLDKGGMPYILHPLHVMDCVDGIDAKIVAVLHDTVEDTNQTLEGLRTAGFSDTIIDAVDAITKRKGEKKREYWARVRANPLALYVKLWDMAHNSSPRRLEALAEKEADYLIKKYDEGRAFFAEENGLVPLMVDRRFIDVKQMLEAVGYQEQAWRMIMNAPGLGTGFDGIIRRY